MNPKKSAQKPGSPRRSGLLSTPLPQWMKEHFIASSPVTDDRMEAELFQQKERTSKASGKR